MTVRQHMAKARSRAMLAATLVCVCWAGPAMADQSHPPVFGFLEDALLMPQGFPIKAKLDTGADNSSVNAEIIERYKKSGQQWIAFVVESIDGRKLRLERPVLRITKIKRHGGKADRRPVVSLAICLGDITRDVPVNLVDRSQYTYNLLIGRSFMAGSLVVDPARQFTIKPRCGKDSKQ